MPKESATSAWKSKAHFAFGTGARIAKAGNEARFVICKIKGVENAPTPQARKQNLKNAPASLEKMQDQLREALAVVQEQIESRGDVVKVIIR
jgi:hypothetical protein